MGGKHVKRVPWGVRAGVLHGRTEGAADETRYKALAQCPLPFFSAQYTHISTSASHHL